MKKYLMGGIAAVAICAAITSCSKSVELYDAGQITKNEAAQIEENYNKAFIATFGQPAANQTWGFGRAAGTRAVALNYSLAEQNPSKPTAPNQPEFRGNPAAPTFNTTVPEGTLKATKANWKDNGSFYIDNDNVDLENPQNQSNVTIYATGNNVTYQYDTNQNSNGTKIIVTEDSKLTLTKVCENLSIYLAPRATLVLPDGATFKKSGAMLYMSTGSTVKGDKNLTFEENYVAFNDGGTFDVKTVTVDGGALLYNKGTLTATTSIVLKNTNGELVNSGTITSPSFDQRSGGKFLNDVEGVATITGKTYLTNTDCVWQNMGSYTTTNVDIENTRNVFNNCKMTVTDTFHFVKNSAFVLDGHASVKTAKMIWDDDCDFYMMDESLLWVEGQLLAKNDDQGYGAHGLGSGSGYSIIKAGSIDYDSPDQSRMNYYGNIYVDTENHFAQGFKDQKTADSSQPYYYFSTKNKTVMFRFLDDACPITSPIAGPCHHGYNPPTPPSDWDIRLIAEDLNAKAADSEATNDWSVGSDWDFNDVVFDVKFTSATTADVKIVGAGGVYPLFVAGHEAHQALGQSGPDSEGRYKIQNSGTSTPFQVTGIDRTKNGKDIVVTVVRTSSSGEDIISELKAEVGKPAAKIGVDPKFEPCAERQDIRSKYPLFRDWVQGKINGAWYQVD